MQAEGDASAAAHTQLPAGDGDGAVLCADRGGVRAVQGRGWDCQSRQSQPTSQYCIVDPFLMLEQAARDELHLAWGRRLRAHRAVSEQHAR